MYIYKTTNLINGKIYIGQTIRNDKYYIGSGKILKQAIKKYGRKAFKKEIIEVCKSKEELDEREKYWISFYKSTERGRGYNIVEGGGGCSLSGVEHYLNKLSPIEREEFLNKYHRGENYWNNMGIYTQEDKDKWIKENWCGKNHSHRKGKTEKEYQEWLDATRRGSNFWLYKLSKEEREKYIKENYKGENNPIYKGKTQAEKEEWLKKYRKGSNAPNAKYRYKIITHTGEEIYTECLRTLCEERGFNLHIIRKLIELEEGVRESYVPREIEYRTWYVKREIRK